ncbi:tRNA pseudouridine38-40 synthase [Saonia flava]|uniref:tRNA pseudouridine synthase A n=1 Tax=Saonia flava TaxID=523696 RepID=A0A846QS62_9FLAO|nr:tRNA pseudouridine38-40 synthase [Saonia flava]
MVKKRYFYLIQLQFLGFRYSGWQKQPGQKTIESMLVKTLKFVLPNTKFKVLGAGRTDSKVSALDAKFELFIEEKTINDFKKFLDEFNKNLPPDIKALDIIEVDARFNIIQSSKSKEYVYLFAHGQKNHPFCAPFLANIIEELDIELMKKGAKLFIGNHNFRAYTARPQENTTFDRIVTNCEITENTLLKANFFPEKSYALYVEGEGFIRYQVRMIMGALILLGKGELTLEAIKESLQEGYNDQISYVAPGSGLLLNKLEFKK